MRAGLELTGDWIWISAHLGLGLGRSGLLTQVVFFVL